MRKEQGLPSLLCRASLSAALFLCGCAGDGDSVDTLVPSLTTSTNALDFGPVYVGSTKTLLLSLTSTGTAPVNVESIAIEGNEGAEAFTLLSGEPGRLAPQTTLELELFFAPATAAMHAAVIRIVHDATSNGVLEVELRALGRMPPDCDDGNPCTDNIFDLTREECVVVQRNASCDDENACTENDRCVQGECRGESVACVDDDNACTVGSCDPTFGCLLTPENALCDDDNPCTVDRCDANTGCSNTALPDYTLCGVYTQCGGTPVCLAGDCVEIPVEDGTPCDDDNVCTIDDGCVEGQCTGTRIEREPELVAEVFTLTGGRNDGLENVRAANLALDDDTCLFPGSHLQVVQFVPGTGALERADVIATFPAFDGPEDFVHVVGDDLAVVNLDNERSVGLLDFTDRTSPTLLDVFPVDADDRGIALSGARVLACDENDDAHRLVLLEATRQDGLQELLPMGGGSEDQECDDKSLAIHEDSFVVANGEDGTLTFFHVDTEARAYTRLGSLSIPVSQTLDQWRGVALGDGVFYAVRQSVERVNGRETEVLTGLIPTTPFAAGDAPSLTSIPVDDAPSIDAYSVDPFGLIVKSEEERLGRISLTGELSSLVPYPSEVTFVDAMNPQLVSYHTETERNRLARIVDGEFRATESKTLGSLSRLRTSSTDLWGFGATSFFRLPFDAATEGQAPHLTSGQRHHSATLSTIATEFPGGQFWRGGTGFGGSPLPSLRRSIAYDGDVTTSTIAPIDPAAIFEVEESRLLSANLVAEECVGLLYGLASPVSDSLWAHNLALLNLCGSSTLPPISVVGIDGFENNQIDRTSLALQLSDDRRWGLVSQVFNLALVDFASIVAPTVVLIENYSRQTTGNLLAAEIDNQFLVTLLGPVSEPTLPEDSFITQTRLQVRRLSDAAPAAPQEVALTPWIPDEEQPQLFDSIKPQILALQPPRVFLSHALLDGNAQRFVVEVYDLNDGLAPPTLDARVTVHDEPKDAVVVEDKLFVLTQNGLATISPPCGPTD